MVSGSHALNKNTTVTLCDDGMFSKNQIIQFVPHEYALVFTVQIFLGAVGSATGGKHHRPVIDRHCFLADPHSGEGGTEVSDKTTHVGYFDDQDAVL